MRFEVPQFIEIEDKIFGPLTWRQFLYLGGGVGMAVAMFFTLPFIVFVLFGIPLALLAGALSFYPVNNRPFSFFLEAIVNYLKGNRLYLWRKKADVIHTNSDRTRSTLPYVTPPSNAPVPDGQPQRQKNIASLSRKLELQALQKTE